MKVHQIAIKLLLRVDEFKDESDQLKIFPQQIKLLNLMKIIIDAKWVIDKEIFSEMLLLTGYMELINDFKHVEKYIIRQKTKLRMEISNDAKNPTNSTS